MEVDEIARQNKAIALYEKGAEKEAIGLMRDAIICYSSALRVDRDVEKKYRKKLQEEHNASLAVRENSVAEVAKGIDGLNINEDEEQVEIERAPCWLLEILPNDILLEIIAVLIHIDPHSHVNLSITCRKLAELAFDSNSYKHIANIVYPRQVYSSVSIQLNNITKNQMDMVRNWDFNWEKMLNDRPFLKYHGCYISKVSYISEGEKTYSYYSPVKVVTYFRYLRFYPDGKLLKLTTTDEPSLIVPYFKREDYKTWKNAILSDFSLEADGHVVIKTRTEQYNFIEELNVVSLGYRKFHRLTWESSCIVNEDNERDYFSLRKEKPFNFSGVNSYHVDYGERFKVE